jgi:hypothetical protein
MSIFSKLFSTITLSLLVLTSVTNLGANAQTADAAFTVDNIQDGSCFPITPTPGVVANCSFKLERYTKDPFYFLDDSTVRAEIVGVTKDSDNGINLCKISADQSKLNCDNIVTTGAKENTPYDVIVTVGNSSTTKKASLNFGSTYKGNDDNGSLLNADLTFVEYSNGQAIFNTCGASCSTHIVYMDLVPQLPKDLKRGDVVSVIGKEKYIENTQKQYNIYEIQSAIKTGSNNYQAPTINTVRTGGLNYLSLISLISLFALILPSLLLSLKSEKIRN